MEKGLSVGRISASSRGPAPFDPQHFQDLHFRTFRSHAGGRRVAISASGREPWSKKLIENNRRWAAERVAVDAEYSRDWLAEVQNPRDRWNGCSGSRVPPVSPRASGAAKSLLPIFAHWNVASIVRPSDLNCLTVLHYAVAVLNVSRIRDCGPDGCGGIRAAAVDIPGRHGALLAQALAGSGVSLGATFEHTNHALINRLIARMKGPQ